MVTAKETAEERLLRMIEGPTLRKASGADGGRRGLVIGVGGWLRGLGDFVGRRASSRERRRTPSDLFLWRLQLATKIFWGLLTVLAGYLVVELWVLKTQPPVVLPSIPKEAGLPSDRSGIETADRLKSLESYQQAIVGRNPFHLAPSTGGEQAPTPMGNRTSSNRLGELAAALAVVGINRGAHPEALIEDTAAKRTYFVKVGDQVNGLTIKTIDSQGVTVTYEGEETLLK